MLVAIAVDHQQVAQHFGHALEYRLYRIDDQKILRVETLINPGHRPGVLPGFLHDHGVNVMIAGGMGESALKLFSAQNITVFTGISGHPDRVIEQYLADKLKASDEPCGHEHHHP
jgi:predicted Fe-Mo cluster-binding NifX family protein